MSASMEEMLKPETKKLEEKPAQPPAEETPKEEPKKEEPKVEEPEEKKVPLSALQEQRQKNRLLKAENEELKKKLQEGSVYNTHTTDEAPKSDFQYRQDRVVQTVNLVRATRPDAQEMLEVFDQAVEQDETLYKRMMESPDPGTFAYEYGKATKNQEKYGTDVEEAFKRGMAAAEKKAKEDVYKEIKNKKDIGEKLPKNIAAAGVSGTGSETAEWSPKSSKEMWG